MMKLQITPKQNIFFCSDPHYNHSGIVRGLSSWEGKRGCRDFDTLEEYNSALVNNINSVVGENDALFCLGDWSFGNYRDGENVRGVQEFRDRLNVKTIHLILGNHDTEIRRSKELQSLFTSVQDYLELQVSVPSEVQGVKAFKQMICMSHYAMRVWNKSFRGSWMLYGHCLDIETEILTKRGWLGLQDLKDDDFCYSYDEESNISKFMPIVNIFQYLYNGKMYSFEGKNISFRGTSKHRHFLQIPYSNSTEYVFSEDLKCQQRWVKLNGQSENTGLIISDDYLRLYVWINADGSFENKHLVRFHLKKERKIKYLTLLLEKLNIKYSINKSKTDTFKINFSLPDELRDYNFKPLDERLVFMNKKQVQIFFEEYTQTDGYKTSKNALQIYSSREKEIDIIQNISVQNNFSCNKTIIKKGQYTGWIASINFNRQHSYFVFKDKVMIEDVIGEDVWCIETKFSNFLIRRNGKTHFTGNSHGSLDEFTPVTANPQWIGDQYYVKNYRTMDVGFDCHTNLRPFSYQELEEIMHTRDVALTVDHHGE